jgi:hypothetical protein
MSHDCWPAGAAAVAVAGAVVVAAAPGVVVGAKVVAPGPAIVVGGTVVAATPSVVGATVVAAAPVVVVTGSLSPAKDRTGADDVVGAGDGRASGEAIGVVDGEIWRAPPEAAGPVPGAETGPDERACTALGDAA